MVPHEEQALFVLPEHLTSPLSLVDFLLLDLHDIS
jgi:hypothetical protein